MPRLPAYAGGSPESPILSILPFAFLAGCPADAGAGLGGDSAGSTEDTASDPQDTGVDDPAVEGGPWCYTFRASGDAGGTGESQVEQLEIDMSTGVGTTWMTYGGAGVTTSFSTSGVAWNGHTFVVGYYDGNGWRWMELAPSTGLATDYGGVETPWVAWSGGDYIVQYHAYPDASRYSDLADIVADSPSGSINIRGATRFTVADGKLYGMWHSTAEMLLFDAVTGNPMGSIPLEGYNTWVWGISVFDDWMFAIDDGRQYGFERIGWFDRGTGELIADVPVPGNVPGRRYSGLHCTTTPLAGE
ncbi:hypothetical protein LBMAG42_45830 [Deltaproteobacteria bacterium]|nr:hypothetical protein LBMAG42_45830 [Deltaproteobacteria bacterium]